MSDYYYPWNPPRTSVRHGGLAAFFMLSAVIFVSNAAVAQCGNCLPDNPCLGSPIIIDLSGNGFHLTSAEGGVRFDIKGDGNLVQIAWTDAGSRNAFLALPDAKGNVVSGKQLFGNFTPQPPAVHPNGFLALAVYDNPENGGNSDGIIDARDKIFSALRLWIDANHDGIAQPEELFKLPDIGVFSISLRYRESRRIDEFGNQFRYRARINMTDKEEDASKVGPVGYDIFLKIESSGSGARAESTANSLPRDSISAQIFRDEWRHFCKFPAYG